MSRLHILVEGDTEEQFVKNLLIPPLAHQRVYVRTSKVTTRRNRYRVYKGGILHFDKVKNEIVTLLKEDQEKYVTTMFDVFRLHKSFPNFDQAIKQQDCYSCVEVLEDGLANKINNRRFIPYLQLHEYEALLFSDSKIIDDHMRIYSTNEGNPMEKIRKQFNSPEEINQGNETAPSKRILSEYEDYDKVLDGVQIAKKIGLEKIREECSHFNGWYESLENL